MSAGEAAKQESTPSSKPKWSRWRKIFAVLGVLILVFVAVDVAYQYLDTLPPEVLASGAPRQAYLDVTLFAFYAPSLPGALDLNVSTRVTFARGMQFDFAWQNVSGAGVPVRFVLAPSSGFAAGTGNAFTFLGGGNGTTTIGTTRPGAAGAIETVWRMDYTVRRLTAWEGFTRSSWAEVDYSLTPVSLQLGYFPLGNVSAPSPADLLPTGVADRFDVSAAPGTLWYYNRSLGDFKVPSTPFVHRLPAVSLEGGSAGNLSATLASTFRWAAGDNYRVEASFSGRVNGTLTWYWDARFGSLYPMFSG